MNRFMRFILQRKLRSFCTVLLLVSQIGTAAAAAGVHAEPIVPGSGGIVVLTPGGTVVPPIPTDPTQPSQPPGGTLSPVVEVEVIEESISMTESLEYGTLKGTISGYSTGLIIPDLVLELYRIENSVTSQVYAPEGTLIRLVQANSKGVFKFSQIQEGSYRMVVDGSPVYETRELYLSIPIEGLIQNVMLYHRTSPPIDLKPFKANFHTNGDSLRNAQIEMQNISGGSVDTPFMVVTSSFGEVDLNLQPGTYRINQVNFNGVWRETDLTLTISPEIGFYGSINLYSYLEELLPKKATVNAEIVIQFGTKGRALNQFILDHMSSGAIDTLLTNATINFTNTATLAQQEWKGALFVSNSNRLQQTKSTGYLKGTLNLPFIVVGEYQVEILIPGFLKQTLTSTLTVEDGSLGGPYLMRQGDMNNDGQINNLDYQQWLDIYKQSRAGTVTSEQRIAADLTLDGLINNLDFSLLKMNMATD